MIPAPNMLPAYPSYRVYLEYPDGSRLQLLPVQGLNRFVTPDGGGEPVEVVMLFAFGPPNEPAPVIARLLVEPEDPRVKVDLRVYADGFGTLRFAPAMPVHQTSN